MEKEIAYRQETSLEMLYELDEDMSMGKSIVYGIQHLIYFVAGAAVVPVIVGGYLGLNSLEIASLVQGPFLLRRAFHLTASIWTPIPNYRRPGGIMVGHADHHGRIGNFSGKIIGDAARRVRARYGDCGNAHHALSHIRSDIENSKIVYSHYQWNRDRSDGPSDKPYDHQRDDRGE